MRVIKLRWMRWTVNAACEEEMRNLYKISVENPELKRPFG
jgi:hypothetical protein